ncbi:MAG: Ig-like domain-containing protein [Chitinophagaceae bacterium]
MRKLYLLLVIQLIAMLSQAQVSVTATAGTTGPTAYTTVNAAFAAINAGAHQGAITITITGNTTEPSTPTALLKSGVPSSYTSILIQPAGGDWTVNSPNQTDNTVMIDLNGADNVTIDGDPLNTGTRHLIFVVSPQSGVRTAVFRLSSATADNSDGAKNNTIKNCIITGSRFNVNANTQTYGIYMGAVYSAISITNLSAYDCTNNRFENNVITKCLTGVLVNGNASFPSENLVIRNNIIGSPVADDNIGTQGISLTNTSSLSTGPALVEGNDIRVGTNNPATTPYIGNVSIRGIALAQGNAGCIVRKNYVHDIINSEVPTTTVGGQAFGIAVTVTTASNNIIIENNFVRDVVTSKFNRASNTAQGAYCIHVNAAVTGLKINNNTLVLNQAAVNGTATNYFSACLNFLNTTALLSEMKNNIMINKQANDSAYIIRASPSNIGGTAMNYNNYFVMGGATTKFGIYNSVDVLSLATWQATTGKDANSLNTDPVFVSATNLHIAPGASTLDGAGTPITGITDDFDNETRNTTIPDIGADEFTAGGNASLTGGPFCGTGTTTISSTGFSAGAGVTYLWQSSADITFTTPVDIGTPSTTYSNLNTGVVTTTTYFRLKVMDGGLVGYSNIVTMQIDPLPNAGTVSGTSPLCLGATTTFTSNGQSGGTWTSSNPAVASIDPTTGFVTTIASGTTNIIYTVTSGLCNSTAQLTLIVNATPSATILYTGSPYCAAAGTAVATITGTTGEASVPRQV